MNKFVVPEVDWTQVTFPLEGENNAGQKVRLLMRGPETGDLFGEVFAGRHRVTQQEFWSSCLWYPDGAMHDFGQWTSDGNLKFATFGKLPRKL